MMWFVRFLSNFVGTILLLLFLACALLTATVGSYNCEAGEGYPTPRGVDCGGDIIGPIAFLIGRPTLWDLPVLFGLLPLAGAFFWAGEKPRPPKRVTADPSQYPAVTLTHISPGFWPEVRVDQSTDQPEPVETRRQHCLACSVDYDLNNLDAVMEHAVHQAQQRTQ